MKISYKKLWIKLLERDLMKRDLQNMAGISSTSIAKLGKGENVNTAILVKICKALDCDTSDIMEIDRSTCTGKKSDAIEESGFCETETTEREAANTRKVE